MNAMPTFNLSQRGPRQLCRHAAGPSHEVKSMRRFLTPPVALLLGLVIALVGCSGETPTSPKPPSGPGTCSVTITLDATSVNPLAGSAVIIRATVKKAGVAVPDGTPVVFT